MAPQIRGLFIHILANNEPDAPAVTWEADDVSTGTVVVIVDVEHDGAARWSGGDLVVSGANRLDIRIALTTTIRGVAAPPEPREKARSRAEVLLAVADSREAIDRHEHAFRASASNFDFELAGAHYRGYDLYKLFRTSGELSQPNLRAFLEANSLAALSSFFRNVDARTNQDIRGTKEIKTLKARSILVDMAQHKHG